MALTVEKKMLRALCRRSRRFNALVSAMEMRAGAVELASLPQYVGVCVSGRCNALCPFCSVTFRRGGIIKEDLDYADFVKIVEPLLDVLQVIGFEGNGEPTLNPDFMKMFDFVTGRGIHTYLITNGQLMDAAMAERLIEGQLGQVNISLNAASEKTRQFSMGVTGWFDKVIENVRNLVIQRNKHGKSTFWTPKAPRITVSYVVIEQNMDEVAPFIKLADELGVDELYVRPLAKIRGIDTRPILPNPKRLAATLEEIEAVLPSVKPIIHFDRTQFRERTEEGYVGSIEQSSTVVRPMKASFRVRCQKPWTDYNNYSVDGTMDVCCLATGQEFSLGKASELTFEEIWNGEMAKRFRRTINSAEPLLSCKACPAWYEQQGYLNNPDQGREWVSNFLEATNAPIHRLLGSSVDSFLKAFVYRHLAPKPERKPRRQSRPVATAAPALAKAESKSARVRRVAASS